MTSIKLKKALETLSSVSQNARDTKVTMEDDAKESVVSNDGAKEISKEQERGNIEHDDTECGQRKSPHHKKESDVEDEHCQSESSLEENTCDQTYDEDSDMRYVCPICDTILYTTHEFTLHIRSHNNDLPSSECPSFASIGKGFLCRICGKILSSSSSLDRHVLVHTGERPFKCKICGFSFTTNGNMHRHMRTHTNSAKSDSYHNYESDVSSDSCGSRKNITSLPLSSNVKKRKVSRADEFNNNIEISPKTISYELSNKRKSAELEETQLTKRKLDIKNKNLTIQKYKCNICDRDDFISLNVLETHLENNHPEHKAKCDTCNIIFKNHRALNLHRFMIHFKDPELENHLFSSNASGTVGFNDLTFVDFSSQKFPHIARVICEQSLHHASSIHQKFQCDKCQRAFPCSSALKIHEQNCGNENYASSGESYHNDNDLSSSDNDLPTDLSSSHIRPFIKRNSSESSEDIDEERKRKHFFAGLHLQNIRSLSPSFNNNDEAAHIDYNNRIYLNTNAEGKDLADIQSIISVTSTGGLLPDLSKSPQPTILEVTPPDSGSRNCVYDSTATEEEQQDCFAADFRKMKLRGEFPCRLCTAVFPNLRALKGHNRVHLSSNAGGSSAPYRCNMCPHSSSDKSALIRHMRTHNGDRPYECGLCHYAFTTKANCERHLRNRHSKMSREEVKKSIIYHPSEDPTNDIEVKISRDDVKRSLFTEKDTKENHPAERQETKTEPKIIKPLFDNELRPSVDDSEKTCNEFMSNKNSCASNDDKDDKEHDFRKCLDVGTMTFEDENFINRSDVSIDNKAVNTVAAQYSFNSSETPLDLTMDVLDLSKKKSRDEQNAEGENKEQRKQDLSSTKIFCEDVPKISSPGYFGMDERQKSLSTLSVPFSQDVSILQSSNSSAKHFDNKSGTSSMTPPHIGVPKLDLTSLYSVNSHLTNPFYLGNSHGFSAFSAGSPYPPSPLPPYFIPPPPPPPPHLMFPRNPTQDFVDMKDRLQKELIRGLQLTSGGSLVLDQFAMASAADRIQTLHQQALAEFSRRLETSKQEIKRMSPLIKNESRSLIESEPNKKKQDKPPVTTAMIKSRQDSSSVKMVIKNGVLIPKQKQRRYRTERPFSCEHCSARFTLRSNMERHIKQQHPQFWTQRQRSSGSNAGSRRGTLHSAKVTQSNITSSDNDFYNHLNNSIYKKDNDATALRPTTPKSETKYENADDINILNSENKSYISDEVKHAITQQLKSKLQTTDEKKLYEKNDDLEDENEDLIIDEGTRDDEDLKRREERNQEESQHVNSSKNSIKDENVIDLASVSRLLDNASTQTFRQYFRSDDEHAAEEVSEEDEEGLVASSASEGNNSGSDENRSETDTATGTSTQAATKKKSAYSLAPNRVSCPYCYRKFPWSSSLRRHILTHTGQKPYKCSVCPLLFTTKSNCDRHLLRKHGGSAPCASTTETNQCISDNSGNQTMQQNYTMRNVPERPYKCKFCPSSTFSTLSNLKKHIVSKHQHNSRASSGFESHGSGSDDVEASDTAERERQSRDNLEVERENQSVSDEKDTYLSHSTDNLNIVKPVSVSSGQPEATYPTSLTTDLPFKCHLCDGMSFSERQDALEHIKENHQREFELLVSKGALDTGGSNEDNPCPEDGGGEENLEHLRGKFPDYANRKVMCAFCLRRFWSAEDLRRHMRTHTGERPFSCDICRRRFTLKHSMLRHRKKHSFPSVPQEETSPSDEETNNQSTSLCQGPSNINNNNNNNNNVSTIKKVERQRPEEETDLISNLLGIQDKSIVDKMLLSKSADDAAKLLGVQK